MILMVNVEHIWNRIQGTNWQVGKYYILTIINWLPLVFILLHFIITSFILLGGVHQHQSWLLLKLQCMPKCCGKFRCCTGRRWRDGVSVCRERKFTQKSTTQSLYAYTIQWYYEWDTTAVWYQHKEKIK